MRILQTGDDVLLLDLLHAPLQAEKIHKNYQDVHYVIELNQGCLFFVEVFVEDFYPLSIIL